MIVDAHSHWLPEEIIRNAHFYSAAWGDIEAQVRAMREQGIARALLSYPTTDAHTKLGGSFALARSYNDAVAALCRRYPEFFAGACVVPADEPDNILDEARRAVEELGCVAVSLASSCQRAYLDDERYRPLFAYCRKERLPVFVHSQTCEPIGSERVQDPLLTPVVEYMFDMTMCIGRMLMAGTFRDFPDVPFIFANFGGAITLLQQRFDATYRMLRAAGFVKDLGAEPTHYLKNIYLDTGGDAVSANFDLALKLVGAEHILWGSDWPAKRSAQESIAAVKALALSDTDTAAILGGNLERLL
jgi:predicted TIM-barrel fold metal-dependent hydrolase